MSGGREYWGRKISSLKSSGLNRAEFCRRRGLNYNTLTYWIRRLADDAGTDNGRERLSSKSKTLPFIEVPISTSVSNSSYEIVLGAGRSIRVSEDFNEQALSRLIRVVEPC